MKYIMRKAIFFAALLPTMACGATLNESQTDTTIVYKDTQVKVETARGETKVSVFNLRGDTLTKVRETTYIDGNEVEKVYVGSPFTGHGNLQHDMLASTLPTIWWGQVMTSESLSSTKTDNIRTKRAGSFELGLTPYAHCFPLDKAHTWGLTTGLQAVYTRQSYEHPYILSMEGDRVAATNAHGYSANHSYMQWLSVRVPLLVTLDFSGNSYESRSISLGLDLEWRSNGSYKYTGTGSNAEVNNNIHLNHWGLGIVEQLKWGPFVVNGRIGVTPLYKSLNGKKALSGSIGIGFDLWEVLGKKH